MSESVAEVVEEKADSRARVALTVAPKLPDGAIQFELPGEFESGEFVEGATYMLRQIGDRRWALVQVKDYPRS